MKKRLALALVAALTLACGGGSPTRPDDERLVYDNAVSGFGGWYLQDINIFQNAGTMTATLTWGSPTVDLDLFWTNSLCVVSGLQIVGAGCEIYASATGTTGTLERLTRFVSAGSTQRLFVFNASTTSTAFRVTVDVEF